MYEELVVDFFLLVGISIDSVGISMDFEINILYALLISDWFIVELLIFTDA